MNRLYFDDVLRAIPRLKEQLNINVELASPDHFIPVPEGWESRSRFIATIGRMTFLHYDLYAQALSKVERGHERDLEDYSVSIYPVVRADADIRIYLITR